MQLPQPRKKGEEAPPQQQRRGNSSRKGVRKGGGDVKARNKLVVRHLPPELTEQEFIAAVDEFCPYPWQEDLEWMYFVQGEHNDRGNLCLGRAYVLFNKTAAIYDFSDAMNGRMLHDTKGKGYVALVEYAPCQKVPRSGKSNPKDGTIENDKEYKAFVEALTNPPAPEPSKAVEEPAAVQESPLLIELRTKIQEKRARAARKEAKRKERENEKRQRERIRLEKQRREEKRLAKEREVQRKGDSSKRSGGGKSNKHQQAAVPKPRQGPEHGQIKLMARPTEAAAPLPAPVPKPKSGGGDSKKGKKHPTTARMEEKKKAQGKLKGGQIAAIPRPKDDSGPYQNFLDLPGDA